jgi:hypothetical protein
VLDFGIAKSAEIEESSHNGKRLTRPGVAMGTPEYMAPEQAAGYPADPRSDISAVGSIMHEMLCGAPPYEGDNVMEVLHKKANEPPKSLFELRPGLTPSVVALVERSMARLPGNRPASMAELAHEIRSVETALVTTAPPVLLTTPGPLPHDDDPASERTAFGERSQTRIIRPLRGASRLAVTAVASSAALLAGGLAWLAHSLRTPPAPAQQERSELFNAGYLAAAPEPRDLTLAFRADGGAALEAGMPAGAVDAGQGYDLSKGVEQQVDGDFNRRNIGAHASRAPVPATRQDEEGMRVAQQLLHAQRYDEAQIAFGKLLSSKRSRGMAAAGLAKIAFQEMRYKEAVELAKESSRFGGGAEARVLLGDAYFKLERFNEAKKAYTEALKLDPNNSIAGQGLRLVEAQ